MTRLGSAILGLAVGVLIARGDVFWFIVGTALLIYTLVIAVHYDGKDK